MSDTENSPEIDDTEGHKTTPATEDDVQGHKTQPTATEDDVQGHKTQPTATEDDDVQGHKVYGT